MVRFGQIMRITQRDGKTKTQQLLDLVDASPGESSLQLTRKMGDTLSSVSSNLSRLTRMGKVRAIRQDGLLRYYPGNYIKADEMTKYAVCGDCGRKFTDKRALGLHYRRVHTEEGRKWTGANKRSKPDTLLTLAFAEADGNTPTIKDSWLEAKIKDYLWSRHIQLPDYKALKAFYDFVVKENDHE